MSLSPHKYKFIYIKFSVLVFIQIFINNINRCRFLKKCIIIMMLLYKYLNQLLSVLENYS